MSENALRRAEMVVRVIARTAVDNETYFCELDAVVGDGDFGYSLARGFEVVLGDWDAMEYSDLGGLLKKTAIVLSQAHRRDIGSDLGNGVPARRRRAERRSRAERRADRSPPCAPRSRGSSSAATPTSATRRCSTRSSRPSTTLEAALPDGAGVAIERAAATAREKAEATKGMVAMRGRASYTGERSRDSVDAGAIGIAVMFEAVSKAWQEAELELA